MGPGWTKRWGWAGARASVLLVVGLAGFVTPAVADDRVKLLVTAEQGFGRLVIDFVDRTDLPKYKITSKNGVLAVEFDEPVTASLPDIAATLPDYVSVGRVDPDGEGIRFALRSPVNINSIEAGEKLFIDLMPTTWQGLPPGLPPEVVAELAERAENAARLAEQKRKAEGARILKPVADLRVGRNPTFMRLQFDWSVATKAEFKQDGDTGQLSFEWPVPVDLYALGTDLPPEIKKAENVITPDGSQVVLTLADGVKPRFYQSTDKQYVVDIDIAHDLPSPLDAAALLAQETAAKLPPAHEATMGGVPPEQVAALTGAVVPVITTVGSTVRVAFPFDRDTPAAVFRRGNTLWMVFDSLRGITMPDKTPGLDAIASSVTVVPAGDSQVVRIELNADRLATLGSQGKAWVLSLGDTLLTPTEPLDLNRRVDGEGLYQITADLERPGKVHEFTDPVVGDTLDVVTAYPPARGVTRDLNYVDFSTLRSVHGLVIRPTHRGVGVDIESRLAVIHAKSGLTVSSVDSRRPPLAAAEANRDRFIDFAVLDEPDPVKFSTERDTLLETAADATGRDRDTARLQLAQYLVANRFGLEALGVLRVLDGELKTSTLKKQVQMTLAIANTEAMRPADALTILNSGAMDDDIDARMWRTIARADAYDYHGARTDALAGEPAIEKYPEWVKARFLLAGIRAAVESGDVPLAERYLGMVNVARLDPEDTSMLRLLSARIDEAQGHVQEALDGYGQVITADFRPSRAEAVYRTLLVLDRAGTLDLDKAIPTLTAESMLWRGGPLEAGMQKLLAELYFRRGEFRLGFETTRQAALFHPDSAPVNALLTEAQAQFTELYLNGQADVMKPIDALGLYYDFRDLTPPGARGDEMIRNLARRLVKVDLLAQAAELLEYQIDNRLKGVAQAQVGADLAVIDIANRDPAAALRVLNKTRLADLAPSLERQRRTLEARALIDAGRDELALDMLSKMQGRDVDLLRVDAHWKAKRYSSAGELLEKLYAPPADGSPMSQPARMSIIKAAVGYVLSGDSLGLTRIRAKFGDQMARSPQWPMFDFVTGQMQPSDAGEFKQVAKEVAGIDSINAFLAAYQEFYGKDGALTPLATTGQDSAA